MSAASDDPIFAAIKEHRAAFDASVTSLPRGTDDETANRLCRKEMAAADKLAKTVPTTMRGLSPFDAQCH
jgi:formiminotetrahydrofolate cyclodeaminase